MNNIMLLSLLASMSGKNGDSAKILANFLQNPDKIPLNFVQNSGNPRKNADGGQGPLGNVFPFVSGEENKNFNPLLALLLSASGNNVPSPLRGEKERAERPENSSERFAGASSAEHENSAEATAEKAASDPPNDEQNGGGYPFTAIGDFSGTDIMEALKILTSQSV